MNHNELPFPRLATGVLVSPCQAMSKLGGGQLFEVAK